MPKTPKKVFHVWSQKSYHTRVTRPHNFFFHHVIPGTKLSEDCFRYGSENTANDAILAKAACLYGGALRNVEKEFEDFNQILSNQVSFSFCFYVICCQNYFCIEICLAPACFVCSTHLYLKWIGSKIWNFLIA